MLVDLERSQPGSGTELRRALDDVAQMLRRRGLVVLFSDMLTDLDQAERGLRLLKASGHDLLLLRILDPQERQFHLDAPTWVRDLETGQRMHIDAQQAAAGYQERFSEHQEQLEQLCRRYEIDHFEMSTADPLDQALFHVLHARMSQQSKQVRRQTAGGLR